jgi:hypothetical protein
MSVGVGDEMMEPKNREEKIDASQNLVRFCHV